MGSPDKVGYNNEHPRHKVYLNAYYMDKYLVTVKQYRRFCTDTGRKMPYAPPWGWQDDNPIVNVSWNDAAAYAAWVGKRLPTEAEWKKACRSGSTGKYFFGDNESMLGRYAWFNKNSENRTHPVGQKKPNAWGLYDMSGNVWEWCSDWYDANYYKISPYRNPKGPASGVLRVIRGGSFDYGGDGCRSGNRLGDIHLCLCGTLGFRCSRSAVP